MSHAEDQYGEEARMTPDEKLEQDVQSVSEGSTDSTMRIGTKPATIAEETTGFPHPHESREQDGLSGTNDEGSEGTKDESDASHHADNVILTGRSAPPSPSAHPAPSLRQHIRRGHTRVGGLVMTIIVSVVVLLLVTGIIGVLIIVRMPTRRTMGTLLYLYHTSNKAAIYPTYINGVAWSPNGQYLACATGDEAVHVLDPATQKEVFVYHGHHGYVNNVAWLPDGKRIASVSADYTVQVWDATTGDNVATFTGSSPLWAVAVSPDGHLIAFAGRDGRVEVWQVSPMMHIYTYTGHVHVGGIWGLAFSADGKRIASGDRAGVIQVWNASNGGEVYVHRFASSPMQAVAWSPDGKRIASASANGTVQVWDAFDGGHLFVYRHHSGAVYTVAWSPDGSRIASGDESGSMQVWQAV